MIFSLEALQAKYGDSFLLFYGDEAQPKIALIDGGPSGVFGHTIKPRLDYLRSLQNVPEDPLPLEVVMLSHIDDDHINGLLSLFSLLDHQRSDNRPRSYAVKNFWFNGFADIVGEAHPTLSASFEAGAAAIADEMHHVLPLEREPAAVVASVGQGRQLRDLAASLAIPVNVPFSDLISLRSDQRPIEFESGLKMTVIGPQKAELDALREDWNSRVKHLSDGEVAEYVDESVYNLSSIVVLVEAAGKRLLLTGDARGDKILSGLDQLGLLADGKIHVGVLKMPHHGSERDVARDFFERVTADRYVISANGKYNNPDLGTLRLLSEVRGNDHFQIYLTNEIPFVREFYTAEMAAGKQYELIVRQEDPNRFSGLRIDLAEALPTGW